MIVDKTSGNFVQIKRVSQKSKPSTVQKGKQYYCYCTSTFIKTQIHFFVYLFFFDKDPIFCLGISRNYLTFFRLSHSFLLLKPVKKLESIIAVHQSSIFPFFPFCPLSLESPHLLQSNNCPHTRNRYFFLPLSFNR